MRIILQIVRRIACEIKGMNSLSKKPLVCCTCNWFLHSIVISCELQDWLGFFSFNLIFAGIIIWSPEFVPFIPSCVKDKTNSLQITVVFLLFFLVKEWRTYQIAYVPLKNLGLSLVSHRLLQFVMAFKLLCSVTSKETGKRYFS